MAASSNFGNVFSVLIASAWLPFLPMLPIHILVQNLLYDFSQIAIPWYVNLPSSFLYYSLLSLSLFLSFSLSFVLTNPFLFLQGYDGRIIYQPSPKMGIE
jgi:Mg2+-importing ATPase